MIEITLSRRPSDQRWDRRGLLFDATARYGAEQYHVTGVHQPIIAALRAVIAGTPGFTNSPWRLVHDGRIDASGPSARKLAALRVEEGDQGTRFRPADPGTAAIYGPLASGMGSGCGAAERGIKRPKYTPRGKGPTSESAMAEMRFMTRGPKARKQEVR